MNEKAEIVYVHCKGCKLFIGRPIGETGEFCKLCGEPFELLKAS